MKKYFTKKVKAALLILCLLSWLGWDLYQANSGERNYTSFVSANSTKADSAGPAIIALVRSDDSTLANSCSRTLDPSYETIEQMVRKAVDLAGGLNDKIVSGMTVLIKPNLVEIQPSGSGNVTDVRVVKAIVKIVDEIDHGKIKILVGDGSPRPYTTFERANVSGRAPWTELYDVPGYQILKQEMIEEGVDFHITNLNGNSDTDPLPELRVVSIDGQAQPQEGKYYIHQDVMDADFTISVPVMKVHDCGITSAMKNQIGIASSSMYGFSKTAGTPADNYRHKLLHSAEAPYRWKDKEIVDLCSIAGVDFVVIDALMCLDIQKTIKSDTSNQVRMNLIIAGSDLVALDHVSAKLMGMNPDDVEHITLGERIGLGTNDPAKINVIGADIDSVKNRFRKNSAIGEQVFGQSNREWILNGTYSITNVSDPINYEFLANEAELTPLPEKDGWTESIYFINDRINLENYYYSKQLSTTNVISYAFTYFDAREEQEAELWVGSDEALKIYLNGEVVYNFNGSRIYNNTSLESEIKKIKIKKGVNRLLIKSLQKINNSYYDFVLNICEVEPDRNYAGNRVEGLKFLTDAEVTNINTRDEVASSFELLNCYPNPFNPTTRIEYTIPIRTSIKLEVYDLLGKKVAELINGETEAGKHSVDFNAGNLSSGIYVCNLSFSNKSLSKKIVLVK